MGYNTVSSTGPFDGTPVTPLVQLPPGGNFPNDNPLIDPSNASLGFYQFRYSINRAGCAPSIKFITLQVQPKANAGVDFSQVICSDTAPFSLQALFNNNDGVPYNQNGVITSSPALAFGPAPTYTLNPAAVPAGVYTLTRTVEWPAASGFTRQCEDCVDSSQATLTIVPAAGSGTPAFSPQLTVCSFTTPLDMTTTLTGETSSGNWYLLSAAAGQPTYTFANLTVNSNLFNNVTQNFATGTQLSNQSSALTINFQTAQRGRVYRFRYITAEGTTCQAQTDVLIYPMDAPLSGTATNETICYHNLPTPNSFPIYSWLTGATATGSWSITSNPARPSRINQQWNQGVTSPFALTRGSDDIFNFLGFRNTALTEGTGVGQPVAAGSAFDFTFTYTNAPPTGPSAGCNTAITSFTKRIIFTYNPGSTNFGQSTPYQVNCTNQAFSLASLISFAENFGQWHVAPTQLAPSSVAVPNLVVGTNSPATLNTGDSLSSANVNFANVPNGTYVFLYRGGSRWDSAEPQCQRNTLVYVTKSCCAGVNAGITNNTGSTVLNCTTSSISLTATGGVSYLWSNGATTPTITVTAPATYTVTVTGSDGCTATASIVITENTTPPNAGITNNTGTTVLGCATTSISLTATGGGTYQWTNNLGTNATVTVTQPGTYTVTVTGANGCTSTASVTITQSTSAPTVTVSSPTTVLGCTNTSIVLTASGAPTYLWNTGATTPSITVTQPGTYNVVGTAANGCTGSASVTITQNTTPPTIAISRSPNTTVLGCSVNSITLTATGANTYVWSTGATTQSITVTSPGTYSVTGTGTNGCTSTASQVIGTATNPTVSITSDNGTQLGCGITSLTLVASGATSYLWSTGATTPSISVTTPGTYSVTGTSANGCTGTASITITQSNPPNAGITNNTGTTVLTCAVTSISLTATGGVSYQWSGGLGNNANATVTQPGTYTVTVTGANGCTSTASITITQSGAVPNVVITSPATVLNCTTTSIILTASGANTYLWSTGATTPSITVVAAGTYSVVGTASNGCTASASIAITQNTTPPVAGITNNTGTTVLTCSTTSISLTATGGGTYQWNNGLGNNANVLITVPGTYSVTVTAANGCTNTTSIVITQSDAIPNVAITSPTTVLTCATTSIVLTATGAVSYLWSTGATTPTITVTQPGTYSVTGTGSNGCLNTASRIITQNTTTPTVTVTSSSPTIGCGVTSVTLTASGASTYLWSTGATTPSITVTQAGTYNVTGTASNGCTASASTTINQLTAPTVTISTSNNNTQVGCGIDSIVLTASGAVSYLWSTGATTPSITITQPGTYSVTGTAANGCTGTANVVITSTNCYCPNNLGQKFMLRHDTGMAIPPGTARITQFTVNGQSYLPPIGYINFNRQNFVPVSSFTGQCKGCNNEIPQNYNQAVLLALQSLNVPCFEFEIPNINGSLTYDLLTGNFGLPTGYLTCSEKYIMVTAPTCVNWTITIDNMFFAEGPPLGTVTWQCSGGVVSVFGANNALLGTNQVPNTQPCGSGQGNNVIPFGQASLCPS